MTRGGYWTSVNNTLHVDFDLYSTLEDALQDSNPWSWCDFHPGNAEVSFPGQCGPTWYTPGQWNTPWLLSGGQHDYQFYVFNASLVASPLRWSSGSRLSYVDFEWSGCRASGERVPSLQLGQQTVYLDHVTLDAIPFTAAFTASGTTGSHLVMHAVVSTAGSFNLNSLKVETLLVNQVVCSHGCGMYIRTERGLKSVQILDSDFRANRGPNGLYLRLRPDFVSDISAEVRNSVFDSNHFTGLEVRYCGVLQTGWILIQDCVVSGNGRGVELHRILAANFTGSRITWNGDYGINVERGVTVHLQHNVLENNAGGLRMNAAVPWGYYEVCDSDGLYTAGLNDKVAAMIALDVTNVSISGGRGDRPDLTVSECAQIRTDRLTIRDSRSTASHNVEIFSTREGLGSNFSKTTIRNCTGAVGAVFYWETLDNTGPQLFEFGDVSDNAPNSSNAAVVFQINGYSPAIHFSFLENPNASYELEVLRKDDTKVLNATYNWWGSPVQRIWADRILDSSHEITRMQVQALPFLRSRNYSDIELARKRLNNGDGTLSGVLELEEILAAGSYVVDGPLVVAPREGYG